MAKLKGTIRDSQNPWYKKHVNIYTNGNSGGGGNSSIIGVSFDPDYNSGEGRRFCKL